MPNPKTDKQICDRCASPNVMVKVEAKAGLVELCLSCLLTWYPGRDAAWLEERQLPFRDHLADRMEAAAEKESQPRYAQDS